MRLTMVGMNVKDLEDISNQLREQALQREVYTVGPVRLPVKKLKVSRRPSLIILPCIANARILQIDTRKAPCGQGKKTWSRYEMRIHKRLIDFRTDDKILKDIVESCLVQPSVDVQVVVLR
jgi:small subunit ribosomal protein S20e